VWHIGNLFLLHMRRARVVSLPAEESHGKTARVREFEQKRLEEFEYLDKLRKNYFFLFPYLRFAAFAK
jgi:hypothetical protein